jgi:hypothetical protein
MSAAGFNVRHSRVWSTGGSTVAAYHAYQAMNVVVAIIGAGV